MSSGRPVGIDEQVTGDPEQPRPDWQVPGAQLRQMPPGPDERFLHDVVGAGPVRTESFDIPAQSTGMTCVKLADRSVCVVGKLVARRIWNEKHNYYYG
jgi:hypothetical protein